MLMEIGWVVVGFFIEYISTDCVAIVVELNILLKITDSLEEDRVAEQFCEQLTDALLTKLVAFPNQAGSTICSIEPEVILTTGVNPNTKVVLLPTI
jgi:hypothetical protein